ncbi:MAG: polyribonucleotide nucleotidyltransferase [Rickettsiales bacterium]|nr:polyribonucleotide nucleotidyltransferase [Rickettsiales bacterium]OUV54037.1 MAG: polyribonucleotide nucleotidyltransferase [Rickettsiales bacterium TMED127]|tara:strand:- start:44008 stop:46095 length:2088 start_codon:yes stop_codon:yes gene_type:complete
MFKIYKEELNWKGLKLKLETGQLARQADGSVLATLGETKVLCTVCASRTVDPTLDFFPLSVHYVEKAYAAGKIPGGFFKREGRPSEIETLNSRLIDRPLRPIFHPDYKNETQVICTVMDYDKENDPAICAMIGASSALTISGIPFLGPVGCARVGYLNGEYILNPTSDEMKETELDLVVAGTKNGVLMVESQANQLSEEIMLGAVKFGHNHFKPVIDSIIKLAESSAKESWTVEKQTNPDYFEKLEKEVTPKLEKIYKIKEKVKRNIELENTKIQLQEKYLDDIEESKNKFSQSFKSIEKKVVRSSILKTGSRIDGRDLKTVRKIDTQIGIFKNVHGSALFTRGETQALVMTTLGTPNDEQRMDTLDGDLTEKFMLHYNFPPFSVGEVGRMGSTGRREIGHGKLAWRAIKPVLSKDEKFPYTVRVVSEITESNGSSSMATVCGTSLSLMDSGVPIENPIAGIAMGLIKENEKFAVLTDILGDEDHLGDMDFKVAGSDKGITALQMDIKINGITEEIMHVALEQAKEARFHILNEMGKSIKKSKSDVKDNAPKIIQMKINKEKIRDVIGSGGKIIRDICEKSTAKVEIDDEGNILISCSDKESGDIAMKMINDIVAEPEIGKIYEGKVVKVMDFGAFVNFMGSRDGLVHISQLRPERVEKTTDVVNEGDIIKVKVIGIDDRGKVKLSLKDAVEEQG